MIFVDANVLLRSLVRPHDTQTQRFSDLSVELLRRAGLGEVEITTSDAVLAEVAFILTAKTHAHLPVPIAAGMLTTIIQLRGFRHSEKRIILQALDLWATNARPGFVDALCAAYARAPGMQLATFDSDFDGLPGIDRGQFGEPT